ADDEAPELVCEVVQRCDCVAHLCVGVRERWFRNRKGFTYAVLDAASRTVIGCVYIYPLADGDQGARALSWVRASHAQLDAPLWRAVSDWLASDWPFASVDYAPRA